ncbi:MAG: hypothetical protein A2X49_13660 [Lentisphaerae bacterium GWF2_52_8]|nr:MAG: hypothetical protein A2X49_13660 [Lentisphaerae bacterium GWF2_52_8]
MLTALLWTLLALLASASFLGLGICWGRKAGTTALAGCFTLCVLILLIRIFFKHFPDIEQKLLPFGFYTWIRPWWAWPVILLVLGMAAGHLKRAWLRIGAEALSGILIAYFCAALFSEFSYREGALKGVPGADGFVRQTTFWSCGAAASASLLKRLDVSTSEDEMARLCGSNNVTGTDIFGICRGLEVKLAAKGLHARISRGCPAAGFPENSLALVKARSLLDHWVLLLGERDGKIAVFDPFLGVCEYGKSEFLAKWRGLLVIVYP